jgi:hypothetical protein
MPIRSFTAQQMTEHAAVPAFAFANRPDFISADTELAALMVGKTGRGLRRCVDEASCLRQNRPRAKSATAGSIYGLSLLLLHQTSAAIRVPRDSRSNAQCWLRHPGTQLLPAREFPAL